MTLCVAVEVVVNPFNSATQCGRGLSFVEVLKAMDSTENISSKCLLEFDICLYAK